MRRLQEDAFLACFLPAAGALLFALVLLDAAAPVIAGAAGIGAAATAVRLLRPRRFPCGSRAEDEAAARLCPLAELRSVLEPLVDSKSQAFAVRAKRALECAGSIEVRRTALRQRLDAIFIPRDLTYCRYADAVECLCDAALRRLQAAAEGLRDAAGVRSVAVDLRPLDLLVTEGAGAAAELERLWLALGDCRTTASNNSTRLRLLIEQLQQLTEQAALYR